MTPMTIRWKPLIVLSGLFLVIAVTGLMAISFALAPGRAEDILKQARAEVKEQKYDRAMIQFRRALQREPKNSSIHEHMAGMVDEWIKHTPSERTKLRLVRLHALADASKYGEGRLGLLRLLLADALANAEPTNALSRAKELLPRDPENPDASFVPALEELDRLPPNLTNARQHLEVLLSKEPDRSRTLWVSARLAQASGESDE